ncbi:MAG: protein phosphatase [Candidatus Muproteobacteria bacterium RIFCSPHIGHO2_12_FULL_60_33]|uniref:Protein phosphatase n=1 Tax=Candidatus Muproteobacteria bacterium RIFCSPLOWO2_01_FULL_60_18 TaxID=1817768 RepID=A0A1F6TYG5_9PROT|nr:MAG: protein phosphatase [Candidatus Muproteobacteria bacterium RIFCSPLOWO2_01_FULL_60_18]OGI55157.1 MAG: protein phosphatase [Candidatus Muproteobacteria bacterium RIFCSPHIGHO2_12_FULL_60_33]OGI56181.1 MAG: protein phosphatase [Candidatus Muproteobacteria bacterium RIFCSPHIGHO2_02_FULL_60_13]
MSGNQLEVRFGQASEQGRRETNDDFASVREHDGSARTVVAAIADGVSGAGGRPAAETTVRGFLDGFPSEPVTLSVERAASRVLAALNRWVHAQGQQDVLRRGMSTTFTAAILRGRRLHSVHVGDTRTYRLRDGALTLLTRDHTRDHPDLRHVLVRAVGLEETVRADYSAWDLIPHDRYLLCCDGVHATLKNDRLQQLLAERTAPDEVASRIVTAAIEAGSHDNATAVVLDVLAVPAADRLDLEALVADLPILELPKVGEAVDGFHLEEQVSDGRYSRLFRAKDTVNQREVIVKFPHPRVIAEAAYRNAFVREAWVASQVRSPYVSEVIELPTGRQTRLYSVMPYYSGETLEHRLKRAPRVTFEEGVRIGILLAKAVYALNRRYIVHRDIKPDNVMLATDGSLRLLDLGVARLPGLEAAPDDAIPGTPSYMAPELFDGQAGDERSDLYALGVTLYRLFSGHYPYGEVEAFSRPRFAKRIPLSQYRPDLPAWLDALLARATAVDPAQRFGDAMELAIELEHSLAHAPRVVVQRQSLYERNPLRFWKIVSLLLFATLLVVLALR